MYQVLAEGNECWLIDDGDLSADLDPLCGEEHHL